MTLTAGKHRLSCFPSFGFSIFFAHNEGLQCHSVIEAKRRRGARGGRSIGGGKFKGVHDGGQEEAAQGASASNGGGVQTGEAESGWGMCQCRATCPRSCGRRAHSLPDAAASLLCAEASPLSAPLASDAGSSRYDTLTMAGRSSLSPMVKPCTGGRCGWHGGGERREHKTGTEGRRE